MDYNGIGVWIIGNSDRADQCAAAYRLSLRSAGCSEAVLVPRDGDSSSAMAGTTSRVRYI